jgi:hypothetical protein
LLISDGCFSKEWLVARTGVKKAFRAYQQRQPDAQPALAQAAQAAARITGNGGRSFLNTRCSLLDAEHGAAIG